MNKINKSLKKDISEGDLSNKSIFQLEEMLAREKTLLSKSSFIDKLPDKGEKIKKKVEEIENKLICMKLAAINCTEVRKKRAEVEKLEWNLQESDSNLSLAVNRSDTSSAAILDSDDDDTSTSENEDDRQEHEVGRMVVDGVEDKNAESTLKMIANSQVTQRQPKATFVGRPKKRREYCPLYIKMLANTIEQKSKRVKFVPSRSSSSSSSRAGTSPPSSVTSPLSTPVSSPGKNLAPESPSPDPPFVSCLSSPTRSVASSKDDFESCGSVSDTESGGPGKTKKYGYDDTLISPTISYSAMKPLSMKESHLVNTIQIQRERELEEKFQPRTEYAHGALLKTGKFSVENVQTLSLHAPMDFMSDLMDLAESDGLSDSDDESEESDESDEDKGADLSKLVNSNLNIK